uniref:Thiamine biosynthesis protein n=1 Tax=Chaetoceros pseudocurvisetus TaxID=426637 RepID=A0A8F5J9H3_9STRA|nr:Thiamine biosynthesis protein [Chaetoceros pseudocurvisetus]
MSNRITFFFNGEEYFIEKKITLIELLDYFNYQSSLFVLEYNHVICNKIKWKEIQIQKNDRIEIITIVGGG